MNSMEAVPYNDLPEDVQQPGETLGGHVAYIETPDGVEEGRVLILGDRLITSMADLLCRLVVEQSGAGPIVMYGTRDTDKQDWELEYIFKTR